jgi:hypothetical protein
MHFPLEINNSGYQGILEFTVELLQSVKPEQDWRHSTVS